MRGIRRSAASVILSVSVCLSVCVYVRSLKRKQHKSSTPNLVDILYDRRSACIDPEVKRSKVEIAGLSWHSMAPTGTRTRTLTPTRISSPTSSRGSSRECRRVVQLATGIISGNRASDVSARILARMAVSVSVSASWNSSFTKLAAAGRGLQIDTTV